MLTLLTADGEIEAEELKNLFKTTVICGGLRDDNEYFSKLIGETEVKEGNVIVRKLLLSPEKLRQLPDNEVIILCKNKRPVKDEMIRNF